MVVHCSKKLKFFSYSTTIAACFLVLVVQYGFLAPQILILLKSWYPTHAYEKKKILILLLNILQNFTL